MEGKLDGQTAYSHRDYGGQICIYIDNFDLHIFQSKIDFVIFEKNVRFKFSQQPRHFFCIPMAG